MRKANMVALGMSTQLVSAINTLANTVTATGSSSQANSFAIVDDVTIFTTAASNSGARLPSTSLPGDDFTISNLDSNTMLVYPPVGGKINAGSANARSRVCGEVHHAPRLLILPRDTNRTRISSIAHCSVEVSFT